MLTKTEAQSLVQVYLHERELPDFPSAIYEEKTIEKSYGWIFFYNSKKYFETGNMIYHLAGNGPIVVDKNSGEITQLGTNNSLEILLHEYENR